MKKALGAFVVKELNEENRTFRGVASTPSQDRVNDIMVPSGAKYVLPMPLLFHHDPTKPIGQVTSASITDVGIEVEIHIPEIAEDGELKREVDKAYQSLKYGLVKGLSIGFIPDWDAAEMIDGGGVRFGEYEWYELSLVTIPCNRESETDFTKEFNEYKAALGVTQKTATGGVSSEQKHVTVKLNSPKGGVKL
mgnify:CR=1 FL=1